MLTPLQIAVCQAVVGIFETGKLPGPEAYGCITNIPGDTGGLTYGKHQTTINSGNLYLLLAAFVKENPGNEHAAALAGYLTAVLNKDGGLATNQGFLQLLRDVGQDHAMWRTQDAFFNRVYWDPAVRICDGAEFTRPLSFCVVYDSCIHGAWKIVRDLTNAAVGQLGQIDETRWINGYITTRRNWLANHSNAVLHNTVYRMDALARIAAGSWGMELPLTVRGVVINATKLGFDSESQATVAKDSPQPTNPVSAFDQATDYPLLYPANPFISSEYVRTVQQALMNAGFPVDADGVYGNNSVTAVKLFQASNGLTDDGIVGPATRSKLGIS